MNGETTPAYGLWGLVAVNSLVFIFFAFSFSRQPTSKTDWRSLGAFSAFILALFTEMYGFPLTIYFLSGWLGTKYPQLDMLSHSNGHLWHTLLGLQGDPHLGFLHILSNVVILAGFFLLSSAWRVLFKAQKSGEVATSGPYAKIRHPQYAGFAVIMFGFLLQWPTIPTLVMFPILLWIYARLARREEMDMTAKFGDVYRRYSIAVPAFIPRRKSNNSAMPPETSAGASLSARRTQSAPSTSP